MKSSAQGTGRYEMESYYMWLWCDSLEKMPEEKNITRD